MKRFISLSLLFISFNCLAQLPYRAPFSRPEQVNPYCPFCANACTPKHTHEPLTKEAEIRLFVDSVRNVHSLDLLVDEIYKDVVERQYTPGVVRPPEWVADTKDLIRDVIIRVCK